MSEWSRLCQIITTLRGENGCAWDRAQTHQSLIPYLQEESAEVIAALIAQDSENLKEELGDLLLQILLHSEIAKENTQFTIDDVVKNLNEKLIRRHPHVFAGAVYHSKEEQKADWARIKAEERLEKGLPASKGILEEVPASLSTLKEAEAIQRAAAAVGFDWDNRSDVEEKVEEELQEFLTEVANQEQQKSEEEFGDLLFALVNLARHLNIAPERALARCNEKFRRRFRYIEERVAGDFEGRTLLELDQYWNEAKEQEKRGKK